MTKRFTALFLACALLLTAAAATAESAIILGVGGDVALTLETTGTGTAKGHGGDVTVTIKATDGVLTEVTAVGEGEDMGGKALETLPPLMAENNTINVDAISMATETSTAIKEAAALALQAAGLDPDKYQKHISAEGTEVTEEAAAPAAEAVDGYTTASTTKNVLSGDALAAVAPALEALSSTLSTTAEAKAEGFVQKEGTTTAQILTINEDGSIGLSTISEWAFSGADNTVKMKLTYGQNALNLTRDGATGTLMVKVEGAEYLLHLAVTDVEVLEYSDAAFEAGEFDQFYSGAENHFAEYHITCDVTAVEVTYALMF